MTIWVNTRSEFSSATGALMQYAPQIEMQVAKEDTRAGYCRSCSCFKPLRVTLGEPRGTWRNLLEGMVCECGLNGRGRLALTILDEILRARRFPQSVVLERFTPMYGDLAKRLPGLVGCEFLGDTYPRGASVNVNGVEVISENMMDLSFRSESKDLIMHFDVLEHIPDWRAGLSECFRVLKQSGYMLFTIPFYDALDKNIVRARCNNGEIEHLLPRAYHGNPLSSEGSLVFIHPSWELYEGIAGLGFASVQIAISYDPIQGIFSNGCPFPDGHMWPVVFVARK
jgi:SAM-dependent methyltransferase